MFWYSCVSDYEQESSAKSTSTNPRGILFKSYKKKKTDPKVLLASDLQGCVFEPLEDIE